MNNKSRVAYPREKTILDLFHEAVDIYSGNIAVVFENEQVSYKELDVKSNQLARRLKDLGVKREQKIGLLIDRSIETIIGILGIMKAGGAYVPLDPSHPDDRIGFMLSDAEIDIVLSEKKYESRVNSFEIPKVLCLDDEGSYQGDGCRPESVNSPEDLIYIIYTSGTTGKPKGVMIEHRNVVRLIKNEKFQFDFNETDVWTMFHSYHFDFSVWEMYGCFLYGGKLVIVNEETIKDPDSFRSLLIRHKVTVLNQTPHAFYNLSKTESSYASKEMASVRYVIFGGDALNPELLKDWARRYPDCILINMYGITETTVHVTYKKIGQEEMDSSVSNIGKAIPTLSCFLLDKGKNLVPVGIPGEICVGGDGVSRGYLNRPELTAEKFVENPFFPGEKMYRSGDLGRWLSDGSIEYIGRMDNQVSLRGFRIELGEIVSTLQQMDGIRDATAIILEREGEKYLAAYYVSDEERTVEALRSDLGKSLPEYMIPNYFMRLDVLPLTSNGKIDSRALPEPVGTVSTDTEYVGPRDELEKQVTDIWKEILKLDQIGVHDNFFSLGGHSLLAIMMKGRIRKEFDKDLILSEFFINPTVEGVAEQIRKGHKKAHYVLKPVEKRDYYEVSSAQKRVYALCQFDRESVAYNIPMIVRFRGTVEHARLENALHEVITRHESLRTYFEVINDVIVQKILDDVSVPVDYMESQSESPADHIRNFIKPFNMGKAPLLRALLLKDKQGYIFVLDIHHIISDGVSTGLIVQDLMRAYNGDILEKNEIHYKEYAAFRKELLEKGEIDKQKKYWFERFSGEIPVLEMPEDFPRPAVQNFEGSEIFFEINKEKTEQLIILGHKYGSTLYMVLLSVVNLLFSKYSRQEDIVIGSPSAGRRVDGLENVVGMFVNTLAMRNYPEGTKTFSDFLQEVKKNTIEAFENEDYQFDDLVEELDVNRDLSRNPLFDVMFALQSMESLGEGRAYGGLELLPYEDSVFDISKFDLNISCTENAGRIEGSVTYAKKLYREETVKKLIHHLQHLIDEVLEDPERKLKEINLITRKEKQTILEEYNRTKADYPREKTVVELFEEKAEENPEKEALLFGDEKLSYGELNERANELAWHLNKEGIGKEDIVGLLFERSFEMLVGILGVLKAGGAYLPLDPEYPEERIRFMLEDSQAKALLTAGKSRGDISGIEMKKINLDELTGRSTEGNPERVSGPENLMYVIYTSGSTGKPKGVLIENRNVMNHIHAMQAMFGVDNSDRILLFSSYCFDASVEQMYLALCFGGSLVLVGMDKLLETNELIDYLREKEVTHLHTVPAFLSSLPETELPKLKRVIAGGDTFRNPVYINEKDGFYNEYGPTETTVTSIVYKGNNEDTKKGVPVGKPIANTKVYILDLNNQMCPAGVAGELCIGGDGVARGYLNRPELTKEKFVSDPFAEGGRMYRTGDLARWLPDGNIGFLGRIDDQVKVRGFRIELGEIETALQKVDGIKSAVCVVKERKGEKYLAAYYTGEEKNVEEIRKELGRTLPDYMLPNYYLKLEDLPLNRNGKVDRKALPEPEGIVNTGAEYVEAGDELEKQLAEVWKEVLGVDQIGIKDHFISLGGDSIKAIQISSRMKKYNLKVEIADIFQYGTIEALKEHVKELKKKSDQGPVEGPVKLTPIQKRFFGEQEGAFDHFNQSVILKSDEALNDEYMKEVLDKIVEHHDALRMIYEINGNEILQKNRRFDEAGYRYECFDLSEGSSYTEAIEKEGTKLQRGLSIKEGRLINVGRFRTVDGDYLLLIIHHLVVDGITWRILLEDLGVGYAQKLQGQEIIFEEKTDSYKLWSDKLNEYAVGNKAEDEKLYWKSVIESGKGYLERKKEKYQVKEYGQVSAELDKEDTGKLLKESNRAYNTRINDILLLALTLSLKEWKDMDEVLVNIEGHGREEILQDMDISRTAGWFTSIYPVLLKAEGDTLSWQIKNMKEALRKTPGNGVGYGILKYLNNEEFGKEGDIVFNYLGELDGDSRRGLFSASNLKHGADISPDSVKKIILEMNSVVSEGKFQLNINHVINEYNEKEISGFTDIYMKKLKEIIDHCSNKKETENTPSDYTVANSMDLDDYELIQDMLNDL